MKKRIFTLSVLTLATLTAGLIIDVKPALAQSARFQFEPNTWKSREPVKSGRYLNQPTTAVGHGMVPKASSIFGQGVSPEFLKPVPKPQQPVVATSVRPSASWGQPSAQIQPKPQAMQAPPAAKFNPNFGNPMQNPPVVAQQQPQTAPPQQQAQPSANRNLSGRMVPKRSNDSNARSAVAGRLVRPKQPTALVAQPKVANYGYQSGSVKPTSSGSGYNSKSDVYGEILNHHR